jgi:hypothetical protein
MAFRTGEQLRLFFPRHVPVQGGNPLVATGATVGAMNGSGENLPKGFIPMTTLAVKGRPSDVRTGCQHQTD